MIMKKSYKIYGMIAIAAVMACNKVETNEQPVSAEEEKGYDVIYATAEATKTAIIGSGINEHVEWVAGDEVALFKDAEESYWGIKYRARTSGSSNVEFEAVEGTLSGDMVALYPSNCFTTKAGWGTTYPKIYPEVRALQSGSFKDVIFVGCPKTKGSDKFYFTAITSVIKIDVPAEKNVIQIELESDNDIFGRLEAYYNGAKWTTSASNTGKKIIVRDPEGKSFSGPVYISVLPCTKVSNIKITFVSPEKYCYVTKTGVSAFKLNTIEDFGTAKFNFQKYSKAFTIDAEGRQVFIAPGNLQYRGCDSTWRFAEHQWDFVGEPLGYKGTVYEGGELSDNTKVDREYSGWIDSFIFGTSGCDPNYPPYYNTNSEFASSIDLSTNTNYDWGRYCDISNASPNDKNWFTMSIDQWIYLFSRETTSPGTYATSNTNTWGNAQITVTINGASQKICGNILLPDYFIMPEGMTFLGRKDSGNTTWTDNSYTEEQFNKMAAAGAVFIPAAGYRNNTKYVAGNPNGYYSTTLGSTVLTFNNPQTFAHNLNHARSVRLVRDVE